MFAGLFLLIQFCVGVGDERLHVINLFAAYSMSRFLFPTEGHPLMWWFRNLAFRDAKAVADLIGNPSCLFP